MSQPLIIVTGASRGIGRSVADILVNTFNAKVVNLSRTAIPNNPHNITSIPCDLSNEDSVKQAITQVLQQVHHIDGLILNAGTLEPLSRIADSSTSLDSWKAHFDLNFFSLITILQLTLPSLRKSAHGGRIVFVSSGAAVKGLAGWGPYNASKAAMNSLCRTISSEEPDIVSVALRPGMVNTEMQVSLRTVGGPHMNQQDYDGFVQAHAQGDLLAPQVPAHVIASLVLKADKSLSGQFLSWNEDSLKGHQSGPTQSP